MPLSPSRRLLLIALQVNSVPMPGLLAADRRTLGFGREATRPPARGRAGRGSVAGIVLLINAVTTFGMPSGWNAQLKHHQRTGGAVAPLAVWLVIGFGGSFTVGAFLSKR